MFVVAHVTDTHLLADGALVGGLVDTDTRFRQLLERLRGATDRLDALVISGDLADAAEPVAYRRLNELVAPLLTHFGAQLVVVPGNHDERGAFAREMYGIEQDDAGAPLDRVHDVGGLRIIALDSTLPGWHHGGLEAGQAEWLRRELAQPAPHGTLLVMHHPPIPYRTEVMRILEFDDEPALAACLAGSDVRAVLCGHLHVVSHGTIGAVPVSVAGASSYVDDLGFGPAEMMGIDDAQSFHLVEVFADTTVHSEVSARTHPAQSALPAEVMQQLRSAPFDTQRVLFSKKR